MSFHDESCSNMSFIAYIKKQVWRLRCESLSSYYTFLMYCLIVTNVLAVSLETVDIIYLQYSQSFELFEWFSVGVFSLEYLYLNARRFKKNKRFAYALSFDGVVDLLSILPFYLQVVFPGADMRMLRALRLLRVLQLFSYNKAVQDLLKSVRDEAKTILSAAFIFFVLFTLSSACIYVSESYHSETAFNSIPNSMYWTAMTMTTVGYGDITPVTSLGKFIAILVAIMGIVVVAVLTGAITSSFFRRVSFQGSNELDKLSQLNKLPVDPDGNVKKRDVMKIFFPSQGN